MKCSVSSSRFSLPLFSGYLLAPLDTRTPRNGRCSPFPAFARRFSGAPHLPRSSGSRARCPYAVWPT